MNVTVSMPIRKFTTNFTFQLKNQKIYSHGQELVYKFISKITNKLVNQLLSMAVYLVKTDFINF